MNLPNWFKIGWWILLFGTISFSLFSRYPQLIAGNSNTYDSIALIIWLALALVPLFSEINLFGIKLKQNIEDLKDVVNQQFNALQTEVRTNIRTEFNPQISFPPPPSDSQLPDLEAHVQLAIENALKDKGVTTSQAQLPTIEVSEDVQNLFSVRFNLEKELRRIWNLAAREGWISNTRSLREARYQSVVVRMVKTLMEAEMLKPDLASAIGDVYSICAPAVHGEHVTKAQIDFVKEMTPGLIAALRSIK